MKDCIFCKIVRGDVSSCKIYEDADFFVFMDAFPTMRGQVLVIPKKHSDYMFELKDDEYEKLMLCVKRIACAMDKAFGTNKTGMVIEGLQVDHVHVRLYPLIGNNSLNISSKLDITSDEILKDSKKIASFL